MTSSPARRSSGVLWKSPLKQIAHNAGLEGGVVIEKVRAMAPAQGLNAATGEYGDMFKFGVVDPAKVTRSALQNAAVDRGAVPDDRGRRRREAREGEGRSRHARRRRHGLLGSKESRSDEGRCAASVPILVASHASRVWRFRACCR